MTECRKRRRASSADPCEPATDRVDCDLDLARSSKRLKSTAELRDSEQHQLALTQSPREWRKAFVHTAVTPIQLPSPQPTSDDSSTTNEDLEAVLWGTDERDRLQICYRRSRENTPFSEYHLVDPFFGQQVSDAYESKVNAEDESGASKQRQRWREAHYGEEVARSSRPGETPPHVLEEYRDIREQQFFEDCLPSDSESQDSLEELFARSVDYAESHGLWRPEASFEEVRRKYDTTKLTLDTEIGRVELARVEHSKAQDDGNITADMKEMGSPSGERSVTSQDPIGVC